MNEDDVREFLIQHPDFLQHNPELLRALQIPHSSGSAVSLVERQVSVLRERNVDLRHRLRDLGNTAKSNDQLFNDTRHLVLTLLDAASVEDLRDSIIRVLRDRFGVEYANLLLFDALPDSGSDADGLTEEDARQRLGALLGRGNAGCGALRGPEFAFLFPGSNSTGSAAIALIEKDGDALGLLAVGSSNAGHYDSDMGTLFLEFGAEVLATLLPRMPDS